jgi:type I restriction enzyme S subunit
VLDCTREDVPYINDEVRISGSAQPLQDGDVVMADTAEDETVGKVTEVTNTSDKPVMAGLHTIPCRVKSGEFVTKWLGYYMNSHVYHDQLLPYIHGIKVSSISKGSLGATIIVVPPKPEQEAIVDALYDVDALITDLQKLIRKKKDIRQGTMQILLSGKKRLAGYTDAWRISPLSKVTLRIGVGLATSVTQYYRDSGTIIFRNLNIKENYLDDSDVLFLDEDFASRNPNKVIHEGDVLTVHTGYVGISCVVPKQYDGALTFTTLITTTNKKELLPEYLSYHLNSSLGHRVIEDLQTSGGRNNLNVSDFEKYVLSFPSDIKEQRAIISVLGDMDNEIRVLEEKLSKYQQIKQGMMEELLTGKVRLM